MCRVQSSNNTINYTVLLAVLLASPPLILQYIQKACHGKDAMIAFEVVCCLMLQKICAL